MKTLKATDARMLRFLDNSWSESQYREFLEIDGAWGAMEGLSAIIGLAIESCLFIEKIKLKKQSELSELLLKAKCKFSEIIIEKSYVDKGFKDGAMHISCENQELVTILYDADFEPGFVGERPCPTMSMTWKKS